MVLLHGFGQFWWAWRHQLEALGRAGYLAVALDLRGYAASDKPPAGYALPELAADAAAVIGSLGFTRAVVVGQGLGGMVAWTMTATEPGILTGVAVVDAPHPAPATPRARIIASPFAAAHVGLLKSPVLAEHAIERADLMGHLLRTWSGRGWPSNRELETYRALMRVPLAAAKALEQFRWAMGLLAGAKRRRFAAVFERRPTVPVLHIQGAADKLLRANAVPAADLGGPWYECYQVPGAGHFVPEEAPDACSSMLLGWLARAAR
ncbi:MAG: alpha/beta hydrolase [Propionibacteriaceae bacterium]|nr:alpha/beta hydrolase [Propionibacteriaceae bacterium]